MHFESVRNSRVCCEIACKIYIGLLSKHVLFLYYWKSYSTSFFIARIAEVMTKSSEHESGNKGRKSRAGL